ncbi:MAG: efflux RND transporter periplasmic adaptor subunit [Gemmataceae bacterium]|nr:efflux RND transporter periplasmic adaptor subunit [Gemmataceae bacterium]
MKYSHLAFLAIVGTTLMLRSVLAQKDDELPELTGVLAATSVVELKPRVTGYVMKVNFRDGDDIKQGDMLIEIDPRPYAAQLDRAKAAVMLAQAQQKIAQTDAKRLQALVAKGAASREDLDKAMGEADVAAARIEMHKAELEMAQLNLEWTRIRAPIAGRIGKSLVTPGNLVIADQGVLGVLTAAGPLHAYFDVEERVLLKLIAGLKKGANLRDAKHPVEIGLRTGKTFPYQGVIDFAANQVDAKTGTIQVRAVLPNPTGELLPGMHVRGRVAPIR